MLSYILWIVNLLHSNNRLFFRIHPFDIIFVIGNKSGTICTERGEKKRVLSAKFHSPAKKNLSKNNLPKIPLEKNLPALQIPLSTAYRYLRIYLPKRPVPTTGK